MAIRFFLAAAFILGGMSETHSEPWPIKKGEVFYKARSALLRQGWRPVAVYTKDEFDFIGEGIKFSRHGFKEVEDCSQGRGYCSFHYRKGDRCMMLVTEGEYIPPESPTVDNWRIYPVPKKNEKSRLLSICSDEASMKAGHTTSTRDH